VASSAFGSFYASVNMQCGEIGLSGLALVMTEGNRKQGMWISVFRVQNLRSQ